MNEESRSEQKQMIKDNWQEIIKDEDKHVFVDQTAPGVETKKVLYGDNVLREGPKIYQTNDRIKHLGFNTISDFDIAIRDLKSDLKNYDDILNQCQSRIDEIDTILQNKNPEHDIIGAIPKLKNELDELKEKSININNKKEKEEKNLKELEAARQEFIKNKRSTYKNESNNRLNTLNELEQAKNELKNLETKIYAGTINNFEQDRYNVLKNEIIPELEEKLNSQKIKPVIPTQNPSEESNNEPEPDPNNEPEEDEDKIVNEEDGSHLTKDSKFKKILKKVLKIGGVLGGVALVAGAIYNMVNQGDSTPLVDIMQGASDTIRDAADTALNNSILDSTNVGDVSQVFDKNIEAMQGINAETPLEPYFQNEILGYATSDDKMTQANSLRELVDAYNNGKDITSVYVGNEDGIDGFVNQFNGEPLTDVLETYGGKTR